MTSTSTASNSTAAMHQQHKRPTASASQHDDLADDPDKLLNEWLGELEHLIGVRLFLVPNFDVSGKCFARCEVKTDERVRVDGNSLRHRNSLQRDNGESFVSFDSFSYSLEYTNPYFP